jgi:hypothetical protein
VTRRQNRVFVVLKLPQSAPALIIRARAIVEACKKHPGLKNPTPSLAQLSALVAALSRAEVAKDLGGLGKRDARDHAADNLREALHALAKCVETQANLDLEHAVAFVEAAGMSTRAASRRRKKPFTVKPGPVPGSVVVEVLSVGDKGFYRWSCSLDGGKTFQLWETTAQSKATLRGLPSGVEVHFYCVATGRDGIPRTSETLILRVK